MADLGAVGMGFSNTGADRTTAQGPGAAQARLNVQIGVQVNLRVPVTSPTMLAVTGADYGPRGDWPVQYFVSGAVKENDVPKRRLVRVYDRATGKLLNEQYSDAASGRFYIVVANQSAAMYVMAFDDTSAGDDFNAQVYDLVIAKR